MKYIGYAIAIIFIAIGILSFTLGSTTSLAEAHPLTAKYSTGGLLLLTGWIVIYINSCKYKGGIANWFGIFVFFISLFGLSMNLDEYIGGGSFQFRYSSLFLLSISVLLIIYGNSRHKKLGCQERVKGYFDKIAEIAFKEGENGETIYFPNGILGKGRLVEDPACKERLFKLHKLLYKYFVPLCILYGLLLGLSGGASLDGLAPIILIALLLMLRQQVLIRGLPVLNERLTVKEAAVSTSKAFHPTFMKFAFAYGVLGILLSLFIPYFLEKPINEVLDLVLIVLALSVILMIISIILYKANKSNNAIK